jgi:hypothetical protein
MARTALALLPVVAALWAPVASAEPRRLPDGPHFVKIRPSTRTVLVWHAVSRSRNGRFQLLRGSDTGGLRLAAVLPAFEGSHTYRWVDRELPADTETVYQLVYDDGGAQVVLVTARLVQDGLRDPWRVKRTTAQDTDPGRTLDSYALLVPSRTGGRLPAAALTASGERGEPLTPPPRRPARS